MLFCGFTSKPTCAWVGLQPGGIVCDRYRMQRPIARIPSRSKSASVPSINWCISIFFYGCFCFLPSRMRRVSSKVPVTARKSPMPPQSGQTGRVLLCPQSGVCATKMLSIIKKASGSAAPDSRRPKTGLFINWSKSGSIRINCRFRLPIRRTQFPYLTWREP